MFAFVPHGEMQCGWPKLDTQLILCLCSGTPYLIQQLVKRQLRFELAERSDVFFRLDYTTYFVGQLGREGLTGSFPWRWIVPVGDK